MDDIYKEKLMILRKRIPIGLRDGLILIEKLNGDLEKAEKQFKAEMVTLAINKTGVTSEVAIDHLIKNRFDITLAIKSIKEELKRIDDARYTVAELILRDHKNKREDALLKIMYAVEEHYNLKRESWLSVDSLKALPKEVYSFMVIMEWLQFEDWEGYDYALSFNLDLVVIHIKDQLVLADLASTLQYASSLKNFIFSKNEKTKDIQHYINASNELREHKEYQKCEGDFKRQRPLLLERLYEFVENNIACYP
ncbi:MULTISPECIES: hypothetical protein [Niastella]|uniref:Uncharacterized protein n=1 Tax=Niastella soli TaxID=2821487 RepID=A0ABS3YVV0_9BACT|nr:hypothetical protein [Niastella soli]MBO9201296.1 hypothetical protein [Niastella soli]